VSWDILPLFVFTFSLGFWGPNRPGRCEIGIDNNLTSRTESVFPWLRSYKGRRFGRQGKVAITTSHPDMDQFSVKGFHSTVELLLSEQLLSVVQTRNSHQYRLSDQLVQI
jgi:hypothetical protein